MPTRARPEDLSALVASVRATSAPGEVEIVFRADEDDPETVSWLHAHSSERDPVLVGPRGRGYADLPQFFNAMAAVATGDLLMCGNDDMRFETVGWPTMLEAVAAEYPDGLVNLGVHTLNDAVFPFSCLTRSAVARLGFLNDVRLLWSDTFLRDVFEQCDRARMVPSVHIRHLRTRRPDLTRIEGSVHEQAMINAEYWALHDRCVSEAIARLGLKRLFTREVSYV